MKNMMPTVKKTAVMARKAALQGERRAGWPVLVGSIEENNGAQDEPHSQFIMDYGCLNMV